MKKIFFNTFICFFVILFLSSCGESTDQRVKGHYVTRPGLKFVTNADKAFVVNDTILINYRSFVIDSIMK